MKKIDMIVSNKGETNVKVVRRSMDQLIDLLIISGLISVENIQELT